MMDVGEVRMLVTHRDVRVAMRMELVPVPRGAVRVPVMVVISVRMLVFLRLVLVFVLVAFRQMQPDAQGHQGTARRQRERHRLASNHHGDQCTDERRDGEVRARPRRSEVAQRRHEQRKAQSVACKAQRTGLRDRGGGRPRLADRSASTTLQVPAASPLMPAISIASPADT